MTRSRHAEDTFTRPGPRTAPVSAPPAAAPSPGPADAPAWAVDSPALGTGLTTRPCGDSLRPAEPPPATGTPVALALSGGGFRATLSALGFVRLLADTGLLARLRYSSSVSGGSIANACLATAWPALRARDFTPEAVDDLVIAPVVDRVGAHSLKRALLRDIWRTLGPTTRTDLLARRLDDWFLDGTELADLDPQVRWIVNAANLTTGVRFTFEREVYGDYAIGLARTSGTGLRLSRAVSASAAVPGLFPPVVLDASPFPCATHRPALLDGGTYDNTGLEALDSDNYRHTFLCALNAGGLLRPGLYGRVPVIRDLARANSLLYRQSTALRTRATIERFRRGAALGPHGEVPPGARRGILVQLSTDFPFADPLLHRWRATFPEHRTHDGRDLSLVPTVFDRLAPSLCRALVHRGWWLGGAGLAAYHPELLPPDLTTLHPPER
ncbi:patatin-like phospholipase family protein [Streptomyces phaeolivaceus]|uniref:Patatin-like phospholipase family protein n=1 Tax=Streptomyces phaeolivaceus TaxID=2653200 RepID=A0A5P8K1E8_9ACTN|nr:patatin-like phospholipase family protein [Streptomyces phaeolivaceus]QFQ96866.1 patatin-like phospholipase family protein [Streptomyces phaeolivaceus]